MVEKRDRWMVQGTIMRVVIRVPFRPLWRRLLALPVRQCDAYPLEFLVRQWGLPWRVAE